MKKPIQDPKEIVEKEKGIPRDELIVLHTEPFFEPWLCRGGLAYKSVVVHKKTGKRFRVKHC